MIALNLISIIILFGAMLKLPNVDCQRSGRSTGTVSRGSGCEGVVSSSAFVRGLLSADKVSASVLVLVARREPSNFRYGFSKQQPSERQ